MLENRLPCESGHSKANHVTQHFQLRTNVIHVVLGYSVKFCPCNDFKLDNLRFLEKEYDSKQQ